MMNYDLIEMVSAGFLTEKACAVDKEGWFHQGHLLMQYAITKLGRNTINDLKKQVRCK